MKYGSLVNGSMWLGYQLTAKAYGQVPGEIVYLVGTVCSIGYLHYLKSRGMDPHEAPEFLDVLRTRFKAAIRRRTERKDEKDEPP